MSRRVSKNAEIVLPLSAGLTGARRGLASGAIDARSRQHRRHVKLFARAACLVTDDRHQLSQPEQAAFRDDAELAQVSALGARHADALPETPRKKRIKSEARLRDEARKARCHQLMVDLELATTCRRPDIAACATQLSAELGSEPTAKVTRP